MRLKQFLLLVTQSIRRHPRDFLYSSLGLLISIGLLSFTVALGTGVSVNVIERVFPTDTVEVEPQRNGIAFNDAEKGVQGFDESALAELAALNGVVNVFPKQPALFNARMWGGAGLFGKDIQSEAFFDGIEPALVADDLRRASLALGQGSDKKRLLPCMNDAECPGGRHCVGGTCASAPLTQGLRAIKRISRVRMTANAPPQAVVWPKDVKKFVSFQRRPAGRGAVVL